MKLFGIDTEKTYTEEEIDAIKERWDNILRNMIVGTFVLCSAIIIVGYIVRLVK
jgi:hypothetical protein